MIPGYRYTAMMVTGILHVILGCMGWIFATAGLSKSNIVLVRYKSLVNFYYGAIICSIWILLVGCIGILAGVKNLEDQLIKRLKLAYMVTAILSAAIFSVTGFTMHFLAAVFISHLSVCIPGMLVMFLEFVLSIVSSSICCCCSNMRPRMVSVQVPAMQPVQTMYPTAYQYQYPGMQISGMQNQTQGIQIIPGIQSQTQGIQIIPGIQNQTPGVQIIPGIQNQTPGVQIIPGIQNQTQCVQTCSGVQNQAVGVQSDSTVMG